MLVSDIHVRTAFEKKNLTVEFRKVLMLYGKQQRLAVTVKGIRFAPRLMSNCVKSNLRRSTDSEFVMLRAVVTVADENSRPNPQCVLVVEPQCVPRL